MEIPGYQIHREIGKGGMATAYLATQESLEREVVLKVLNIDAHMHSETLIERFLAEGRIVATLNHPNIITIFDIGIADDSLYLSMEYVGGGDLKSRMKSPLEPIEALNYLYTIGSGLDVAHKHGIVHRDVKPANILFREDETLLLSDFGIAKQVNLDSDLTATGMFIGSPNYVSPEQAGGAEIDGRTDIYSMGCIFYEMLASKKPFQADNVLDVIIQHKQAPIPKLPAELKDFQPLLNKMMAKDPKDRFENVAIMNSYIENQINKRTETPSYGLTIDSDSKTKEEKQRSKNFSILIVSLIISAVFYGSLNYLEIKIKRQDVKTDEVTIETALTDSTPTPVDVSVEPSSNDMENKTETAEVSEEVINALLWLGKQSLEEYRLTYPPKDNAHYYFSRLLEIDPNSRPARLGLLNIADRYAVLAEQSLVNNEFEKTEAYINIGLKVDSTNETLLQIQKLSGEIDGKTFFDSLKGFFTD
jgi:serine/threonine protein kinase